MKRPNSDCGTSNHEGAEASERCGADLTEAQQVVCPRCGRHNPAGYARCRRCGYEPVELKCLRCGNNDVEIDDLFCWKCKARLHLGGGGRPYANCQVGEHFFFGSYPQGKNGEVQPIEWRVLERESDRLLVIAEYGLDCKQFNEERVVTNWSQCTLRSWLNGEFMEKAFKPEEAACLMRTTFDNQGGSVSTLSGSLDTEGRVFLLRHEEAVRYFSGDGDRSCKPTDYAVEQGVSMYKDGVYAGKCMWCLCSPGFNAGEVESVDRDGSLFYCYGVEKDYGAVRPAAFLAL